MTITRRGIADEIDRLDHEISELQRDKAEIFAAYREQLENSGMAKSLMRVEVAALKAAVRQRRALKEDRDAVETKDALTEEILDEIQRAPAGTQNAPRARARETADNDSRAPTRVREIPIS